jgi:hypothetical protein
MVRRIIILGIVVCFLITIFINQTLSQILTSNQIEKNSDQKPSGQMTTEERKKEFEKRVAKQRQLMLDRQLESRQHLKDYLLSGKDDRRNKFIKKILEVTDEQWKVIEPKINKIYFLRNQSIVSIGFGEAGGGGGGSGGGGGGSGGGGSGGGGGSISSGSGGNKARGESVNTGSGDYRASTRSGGDGSGSGGFSSSGADSANQGPVNPSNGPQWGVPPLWRQFTEREPTDGEKICEELFGLLQDKNSKPEQIRQKMDDLRKAREEAEKQLIKIREELRRLLTTHQEAMLIMMGILD